MVLERSNLLLDWDSASIYLVGCGGTGGFIAPLLDKLVYRMNRQKNVSLTYIDHDRVEEKNLLRQRFEKQDISNYKSIVLALKAISKVTVSIEEFKDFADKVDIVSRNTILIVIGAVDTAEGRRQIAHYVERRGKYNNRVFWIDCGNTAKTGQVILGNSSEIRADAIGYSSVPWPSIQEPDLLIDDDSETTEVAQGCAEMEDQQHFILNSLTATYCVAMLEELLENRLQKRAVYFNRQVLEAVWLEPVCNSSKTKASEG